jgi:hypothetical protein
MVAELSTQGAIPATTVADAVAGDAMAFARIVRAHHDDMARACHVICGDVELAQDATQAAWPIVWRKLGSLRDPGQAPAVARHHRCKRGSPDAPPAASGSRRLD